MIDSRAPLGESFSSGDLPPWKIRKSRAANVAGVTIFSIGEGVRQAPRGYGIAICHLQVWAGYTGLRLHRLGQRIFLPWQHRILHREVQEYLQEAGSHA